MKRKISGVLILVLGFCGTLLAMDLYLQAAEIQTPMETRIDPETGPAYVNGKKVTRFNEGFYIGGINSQGYYGPARVREADHGEKRILMLGDSFVMGITLFERYHFGTLLESELNEDYESKIEILNFGRADFNFWNMYQYYLDFASKWDHDLVLFLVGRTDIIPARQIETDLYPFCYLDGDSLRINYEFRNSNKFKAYTAMAPLVNNSSLFRMSYNTRKMIARGELTALMLDKFAPLFDKESKAPRGEAGGAKGKRDLPPVTLAILDKLSRNPKAVLVIKKPISEELRAQIDQFSLPVVDISGVLTGLEDEGIDPYYWPVTGKRGHWNHLAHERIASALREELRRELARRDIH